MNEYNIIEKLKNEEFTQLTSDEVEYIKSVLLDPLQEFCRREAPFRLKEYFNTSEEEIEKLKDGAEEVIRNVIDNCECLYDQIDEELRTYVDENKDNEDDEEYNDEYTDHIKQLIELAKVEPGDLTKEEKQELLDAGYDLYGEEE